MYKHKQCSKDIREVDWIVRISIAKVLLSSFTALGGGMDKVIGPSLVSEKAAMIGHRVMEEIGKPAFIKPPNHPSMGARREAVEVSCIPECTVINAISVLMDIALFFYNRHTCEPCPKVA